MVTASEISVGDSIVEDLDAKPEPPTSPISVDGGSDDDESNLPGDTAAQQNAKKSSTRKKRSVATEADRQTVDENARRANEFVGIRLRSKRTSNEAMLICVMNNQASGLCPLLLSPMPSLPDGVVLSDKKGVKVAAAMALSNGGVSTSVSQAAKLMGGDARHGWQTLSFKDSRGESRYLDQWMPLNARIGICTLVEDVEPALPKPEDKRFAQHVMKMVEEGRMPLVGNRWSEAKAQNTPQNTPKNTPKRARTNNSSPSSEHGQSPDAVSTAPPAESVADDDETPKKRRRRKSRMSQPSPQSHAMNGGGLAVDAAFIRDIATSALQQLQQQHTSQDQPSAAMAIAPDVVATSITSQSPPDEQRGNIQWEELQERMRQLEQRMTEREHYHQLEVRRLKQQLETERRKRSEEFNAQREMMSRSFQELSQELVNYFQASSRMAQDTIQRFQYIQQNLATPLRDHDDTLNGDI